MSEHKKHLKTLFFTIFSLAIVYIFIFIVVNPYDRFFFNPNKSVPVIEGPDRYVLPSLTRKTYFDSLIIGTSVSMLLKPMVLNSLFDAKFVNLSMPSATPHEQIRLLQNFLQHHPIPKICIICLDVVWIEDDYLGEWNHNFYFPKHFLEQSFLSLIEDLTNCLRMDDFKNIIKKITLYVRKTNGREDGYHYFLPPNDQYDLNKAVSTIYKQSVPITSVGFERDSIKKNLVKKQFSFKKMMILESLISKLPAQTKKIFILPPYHIYCQANHMKQAGDKWRAFKQYAATLKNKFPNTFVIDFMFHSKITSNDFNFWDQLHYKQEIGDNICRFLFNAVIEGKDGESYERY